MCIEYLLKLSPSESLHMLFVLESYGAVNWEVVDAKAAQADSMRFYLNVCHKVVQSGGAAGCPEDAAICAIGVDPLRKCQETFFVINDEFFALIQIKTKK